MLFVFILYFLRYNLYIVKYTYLSVQFDNFYIHIHPYDHHPDQNVKYLQKVLSCPLPVSSFTSLIPPKI